MNPQSPNVMALVERCNQLVAQGEMAAAVQACQRWMQDYEGQRHCAVAAFHLGLLLRLQNDLPAAAAAYHEALRINPFVWQARVNLGLLQEARGSRALALSTWQQAMMEDAGQCALLNHTGRVLEENKLLDSAELALRRSLALDTMQSSVVQHWAHLRAKQCRWPVLPAVMDVLGRVRSTDELTLDVGPFGALALIDEPARQLQATRHWLEGRPELQSVVAHKWAQRDGDSSDASQKRLRVGYLSGDFRLHAVGMLAAPLLESHNRDQVEVFMLDYTPAGHEGDLRHRLLAASEHHVALQALSDAQSVALIVSLKLDVLVDLTGLTAGARLAIVAVKPAPVVVSYLGFIGSMGLPAVDYVLTDRFAYTDAMAAASIEKPLYFPGCYQINEVRSINAAPSRESQGLPENAFVFCAFSNSYKITPEVFALWMQVLHQVPGSVLWLLQDNLAVPTNLRREAQVAGIDGARLVFAGRVSPAGYLARYGCADLFLDTSPYGAGLTASDALYAGLPVLTCPGQSFVSRMAGSLLTALSLPELIAPSKAAYVASAVKLAVDPVRIAELKMYLLTEGRSSDVFNPQVWVEKWEAMLRSISLPPREIKPIATQSKTMNSSPKIPAKRTFLHVGCGPATQAHTTAGFNQPEWQEVRLDVDASVYPDVVGTMTDMRAVATGTMDAVFSSHNIEHLYAHEVPVALAEFVRVLNEDGVAVVVCPNLQEAAKMVAEDRLLETAYESPAGAVTPFDMIYSHRAFTHRDKPHWAHHCGFTKSTLQATLLANGFKTVGVIAVNFELRAIASKQLLDTAGIQQLAHAFLNR